MNDKEIRIQIERFADEVFQCKSKAEADALWDKIKLFIKLNNCDEVCVDVFAEYGAGQELAAMCAGERFNIIPTKPTF